MPERINLTGASEPAKPTLSDSGGAKGQPPTEGLKSAPITLQGTVTEEQALGASDHAKIHTLTGPGGTLGPAIQTGQSVPVGSLIDGKLAVELMDATLPALMVFLLYKIGLKVRKTELQLTEKEKSVLAPIVTKCLETLMINFNNPWAALGVTLLAFYGAKVLPSVAEKLEEKGKAKQTELTKEAVKKNEPVASEAPKADVKSAVLPWEPTEQMIKDKMKAHKYSRKRSIEVLKVLHNQNKI